MGWIWKHGEEIFILFLFPIIGLMFDSVDNRRKTYILLSSTVFLIPIFTGYTYIISWLYQILGLVVLSCIYSFCSTQIKSKALKITSAIVISGVLLILFGFFAFMDAFGGYQKVENEWEVDGYKIEYIRDQGFSGEPLFKYELKKYTLVPIFIKQVETVVDHNEAENCHIIFTSSKIDFDKCNESIKQLP